MARATIHRQMHDDYGASIYGIVTCGWPGFPRTPPQTLCVSWRLWSSKRACTPPSPLLARDPRAEGAATHTHIGRHKHHAQLLGDGLYVTELSLDFSKGEF